MYPFTLSWPLTITICNCVNTHDERYPHQRNLGTSATCIERQAKASAIGVVPRCASNLNSEITDIYGNLLHSYWTWPIEIVDLPNLKIVIFHSYVSLPEGTSMVIIFHHSSSYIFWIPYDKSKTNLWADALQTSKSS